MAQDMWQRDSQQRNVLQIVDEAGKLYDKFATFSETFLKIENKLEDAQKAFGEAKGQLRDGRGDILGRFDKLKALGAKTKKGTARRYPASSISLRRRIASTSLRRSIDLTKRDSQLSSYGIAGCRALVGEGYTTRLRIEFVNLYSSGTRSLT